MTKNRGRNDLTTKNRDKVERKNVGRLDLTTKNKHEVERKNAGRLESSDLHEECWTNSEDCDDEEVKLDS